MAGNVGLQPTLIDGRSIADFALPSFPYKVVHSVGVKPTTSWVETKCSHSIELGMHMIFKKW